MRFSVGYVTLICESDEMTFSDEQLEAIVERAAEKAAAKTLKALGLSDGDAAKDLMELRSVLDIWRTTRREIWLGIVRWATVAIIGVITTAVYFKAGSAR